MILLKTPEGRPTSARLTTQHAASSYGLPVLVLEDGTALGPGEVGWGKGWRLDLSQATPDETAALIDQGYRSW